MENLKEISNELYGAIYGLPRRGNAEEIWNGIKNNKEMLKEAIKIVKDKFGERDILASNIIADTMLVDYKNVDSEVYNNLINEIYTNKDIARIVLDGASNGGYSFLLMSLWNLDLKLTDEQKAFAVDEAMNKSGTVRSKQIKDEYSKKLDEMGITDESTVYIEMGGCKNPIGQKSGMEYVNSLFAGLSDSQVHGTGDFDIRYWILRNPNWTVEEKQKLIMDFWYNDETYDEHLEQWKWGIVNDSVNYKGNVLPLIDKWDLFHYSYDELLRFYGNTETTDRIWSEIDFCRLMHQLRPQQWELEFKQKVITK